MLREEYQQERFVDFFKDKDDFVRRIDLPVKVDDPRRFTIRPGTRALVYTGQQQSEVNGLASLDFFEISGGSTGGGVTPRMLADGTAIVYRPGTPVVSIFLLDAGRPVINICIDAITSDNEEVEVTVDVALEVESVGRLINIFGKSDTVKLVAFKDILTSKISPILEPATREVKYESLTTLSGRRDFCKTVQEACTSQLEDNGLRIAEIAIVAVIPGDVRNEYQRKLNAVRELSLDDTVLEQYLDEQVRRHRILLANEHEGLSLQRDSNAIEVQSLALDLEQERQFNEIRIEHDSNLVRQESLTEELRKLRESRETGKLRTDTDELISRVDIETRRRTHLAIVRGLDIDDKIGDFKDERRFQDFVRETERSLKLDTVLSDAEISELHRSIGNKEKYAQVLNDIALRKQIRTHELDEARHHIDLLAPARAGKIADAELSQRLQTIEIAMQFESASITRTILDEDSKIQTLIKERNLKLKKAEEELLATFEQQKSEHVQKIKDLELQRNIAELQATTDANIQIEKAMTENQAIIEREQAAARAKVIESIKGLEDPVALAALGIDAETAKALALYKANSKSDSQIEQVHALEKALYEAKIANLESKHSRDSDTTETVMGVIERQNDKTFELIQSIVKSLSNGSNVTNNNYGAHDIPRPLN